MENPGLTVVMPDGSSIPWSDLSDGQEGGSSKGAVGVQGEGGPQSDVRIYKHWSSSSPVPGGDEDLLREFTLLKRISFEMMETVPSGPARDPRFHSFPRAHGLGSKF